MNLNLLHMCISYLDSYVCMKHCNAAVTENFAYLYIIFWLFICMIHSDAVVTLNLLHICISYLNFMYVWNIATLQWLWTFCIFVCHVCIFRLSHTCLKHVKHSVATGTLNLLHTSISYFHSGTCIWNIVTPMSVLTQEPHGGLALLAPGHFETSVQTSSCRLSVNGTVAIWFCCFSDTLVADGLAPTICHGIHSVTLIV